METLIEYNNKLYDLVKNVLQINNLNAQAKSELELLNNYLVKKNNADVKILEPQDFSTVYRGIKNFDINCLSNITTNMKEKKAIANFKSTLGNFISLYERLIAITTHKSDLSKEPLLTHYDDPEPGCCGWCK